MTPPIWLNESGHQRPVHHCVPCGREAPTLRLRQEHLRLVGWRLFTVASYTNWCGHSQEFILVPDADGWCPMIPVLGEAG